MHFRSRLIVGVFSLWKILLFGFFLLVLRSFVNLASVFRFTRSIRWLGVDTLQDSIVSESKFTVERPGEANEVTPLAD